MAKRYTVEVWIGSSGTNYYRVVDTVAGMTIGTYRDHESAYRHAEGLNIAEQARRRS